MPTNEQLRQALFELRFWRMRYKEGRCSDEYYEAQSWLRSLWMQIPASHLMFAEITEALDA